MAGIGCLAAVLVAIPGAVSHPDPAGPPAPRALRVVGLGDSVTAASGCDCLGFVPAYAALVHRRSGVATFTDNQGVPGLTSADLRDTLESDGDLAAQVRTADVVLITIGANDFGAALEAWQHGTCDDSCAREALPQVAANVRRIVGTVDRLRGDRPTQVIVTDYWNLFEDGETGRDDYGVAYLDWSDRLTRAANSAICSAAGDAGATCVDLYTPFKGDGGTDPTPLLAADGDHPNAAGHDVIATAIARTAMAGTPPAAAAVTGPRS